MKRILWILLPAIALGGLIMWRLQKKEQEALAQTKQQQSRSKAPVVVTVAAAETRDVIETVEASGSVEAPFNVNLSARSPARIEFLQVREGDRVEVGQVLIRLDGSDVEADVRRQQALVAEARSRLAQAMITESPANTSIESLIREREADLAAAEADRDQVKQNSAARRAATRAAVDDAQGRINDADAAITNAEAGVRSAQASLANARAKLARVDDLYKQGFIAAQEVDDARTAAAVQEQEVEVARGRLESAKAVRASMVAQKEAAQKQYEIGQVTTVANQKVSEARVRQAQAALTTARANVAQKPAYRESIAALRAAVSAADAALRSAEARRTDTVIRAPLSGTVSGRHMDPGALATPGQPIVSLQAASEVWVTFTVPEAVSRKVRPGMPVTVKVDSAGDRKLEARIVQVNPAADPASRQFQVRAALDNRSRVLKPGMYARVVLETARVRDAVVVPRGALQSGKNGTEAVLVSPDSTARRVPVSTGAEDANGVAVTSGISPGDRVVTMSASPVKDGAAVKISAQL